MLPGEEEVLVRPACRRQSNVRSGSRHIPAAGKLVWRLPSMTDSIWMGGENRQRRSTDRLYAGSLRHDQQIVSSNSTMETTVLDQTGFEVYESPLRLDFKRCHVAIVADRHRIDIPSPIQAGADYERSTSCRVTDS